MVIALQTLNIWKMLRYPECCQIFTSVDTSRVLLRLFLRALFQIFRSLDHWKIQCQHMEEMEASLVFLCCFIIIKKYGFCLNTSLKL